jgi:hypothetical protein
VATRQRHIPDDCISGSRYRLSVQHHTHFPAQQIKQNGNTFMAGHSIEQTKRCREYSMDDAHLITNKKSWARFKVNETSFVLASFDLGDDSGGYFRRRISIAQELAHADCRMNASPALASPVDGHEQVAWEQWRGDRLGSSRVTPLLQIARQVNIEALPQQMRRRLRLAVRMRLDNMPIRFSLKAHATLRR